MEITNRAKILADISSYELNAPLEQIAFVYIWFVDWSASGCLESVPPPSGTDYARNKVERIMRAAPVRLPVLSLLPTCKRETKGKPPIYSDITSLGYEMRFNQTFS